MYEPSPEDSALHPLPQPPVRLPPEAQQAVRTLVVRYFFGGSALIAGLAGAMFLVLPPGLPPGRRALVVALFAVLSGAAAGASVLGQRWRRLWVDGAMLLVLALSALAIALTALVLGWGVGAAGFGFYGVFVCVLCAAASRRMGVWLAGLEAALLLGVAVAAQHGVLAAGAAAPASAQRLLSNLLLVAVGLGGGLLVSRVVGRYVQSAHDREERFRGLLAIAADAYWEIDQDYRLVAVNDQRDSARPLSIHQGLGRLPWDLPQFSTDGDLLDAVLADLDTRLPFRDRQVQWQRSGGEERVFLLSGEPRFDHRGVFKGYWGVARDVTDEMAARSALAATETRYQELFARIPTPLVLHRHARVIDANPAALAMFGFDELAAMHGSDLLAAYESGDSRERERRRVEALAALPSGTALPVADFRLQVRGGRHVDVRATGVRVDADSGPAILAIYVDESERRNAEDAVRRSEALLSHVVAMSPDVITLTELASGRYARVNATFERLTGYRAAEVVGRTAAELGIWQEPADRERFVGLLKERNAVTDMPTVFRAKAGHGVPMLVSGARFVMDRRDYLVINARDISESERIRMEREAILQNVSIGIAVTRKRQFVLTNPRFDDMFGWPLGTLVGETGRAVWESDAAYEDINQTAGPRLVAGEQVEIERPMMRRDGSTFLARILAQVIDPSQAASGTVWIVEDITQRRHTEQALAAARDAAEAASRAKSAFLANTSHELRTPLNGMLLLAQLARDPALDAARRHQYLDQIADSAQALTDIISDILDVSKIEAGKLELENTPFDLAALLQAAQRAYATLATARSLRLELEAGADIGHVMGDALRVRQILGNFLSNAIKFTATGTVRVVARRRSGDVRVLLEVHDSGPGIDAETQSRLFRPFMQADVSTTRRFGGTGLGLSICRDLALLMGGEVGVRSHPGAGSVFWALLPLPPCSGDAAAGGAVPAAPHAAGPELRGARVLMAEDNAVNMMIAVALLERWGVQVEQAADGRQAVAAVERAFAAGRPFDAVLMDVQMPVMSGYEATRALRQMDAGRRMPVIALTAAALVSERQSAMAAGMDDFLAEPIDAGKLRETLARWVRKGA